MSAIDLAILDDGVRERVLTLLQREIEHQKLILAFGSGVFPIKMDAAKVLSNRREAFMRRTKGNKVHHIELPAFKNCHDDGDNIYNIARRLLADAPTKADGVGLTDVIETYRGGILSQYGVIAELVQWKVVERKDGNPTFQFKRWTRMPPELLERLEVQSYTRQSRTAVKPV